MRQLILLLVISLLLSSCFATRARKGESRIVGGQKAVIGQFPFVVYLSISGFYCTGYLISLDWVVSAAHCVYDIDTDTIVEIYAGALDPSDSSAQYRTSTEYTLHPDYESDTELNDVAVLHLSEPFIFSDYVKPIAQANSEKFDPSQEGTFTAYAVGWGTTLDDNDDEVVLRYVDLPYVDFDKCEEKWWEDEIVKGNHLCFGGVVGKDSCYGDSGGPILWTTDVFSPSYVSATSYVVGITSFGRGCASKTPGIYSDVPGYAKEWIDEQVGFDTISTLACGDGIVSTEIGEQCDYGSKKVGYYKKRCCDSSTCTYLNALERCGKTKLSERLENTCLKKFKTCTAQHTCNARYYQGKVCKKPDNTKGTCIKRTCQ